MKRGIVNPSVATTSGRRAVNDVNARIGWNRLRPVLLGGISVGVTLRGMMKRGDVLVCNRLE